MFDKCLEICRNVLGRQCCSYISCIIKLDGGKTLISQHLGGSNILLA